MFLKRFVFIKTVSVVSMFYLLVGLFGAPAQASGIKEPMSIGGTSGGGGSKPNASFGSENLEAILKSKQVNKILGFNFSIESVVLSKTDTKGFHYQVIANTRIKTIPCVMDVTVWNTDAATAQQVQVTAVNVVSGCSMDEVSDQKPVSVFEKYKSTFDHFPNGMDENRLYQEYLKVARDVSPSLRKEIREHMRISEPKFYQVYRANAKAMAAFMKKYPQAKEDNALAMLCTVMGFPLDGGGIYMPAVIGLKLAPFFIVDADTEL